MCVWWWYVGGGRQGSSHPLLSKLDVCWTIVDINKFIFTMFRRQLLLRRLNFDLELSFLALFSSPDKQTLKVQLFFFCVVVLSTHHVDDCFTTHLLLNSRDTYRLLLCTKYLMVIVIL